VFRAFWGEKGFVGVLREKVFFRSFWAENFLPARPKICKTSKAPKSVNPPLSVLYTSVLQGGLGRGRTGDEGEEKGKGVGISRKRGQREKRGAEGGGERREEKEEGGRREGGRREGGKKEGGKEEGGRRKEEGGRRKEEGGRKRRKVGGGSREEEGGKEVRRKEEEEGGENLPLNNNGVSGKIDTPGEGGSGDQNVDVTFHEIFFH
jgi:hypothetical protein